MKLVNTILTCFALLIVSSAFGQTDIKDNRDTCYILVPDDLTSNGNDKLTIEYNCPIIAFSFKLYDQNGKLIYFTDSLSNPLDLDINNKIELKRQEQFKYPSGTYYWLTEYAVQSELGLLHKYESGYFIINH